VGGLLGADGVDHRDADALETQTVLGYALNMSKKKTPGERQKDPAAVSLGRRGGKVGGKVKSEAKAAAARENGKKGGRPRKSGG